MNINFGNQMFLNVDIPLLWGERAILMDKLSAVSVVNLSKGSAFIEILGDKPSPGVPYEPTSDGFKIFENGVPQYRFSPSSCLFSAVSLKLPDVQITKGRIRVGTNTFSSNMIVGSQVGIAVDETGIKIGASLPGGLAKLKF